MFGNSSKESSKMILREISPLTVEWSLDTKFGGICG